jgi:DNA-binding NtrC family response regulator
MASLYVQSGPGQGSVFELEGQRVWVGRGPDCDVTLGDRTVSREHAVFVHRRAGWYLQDLESQNGTLINGQPVVTARLADGDELCFGNVTAVFRDAAAGVPAAGPRPTESAGPQNRATEVTQVIRLEEIQRTSPARGRLARQASQDDLRLSHLLRLTEVAASVRSVEPLFDAIIQGLQIALPADLVVPFLLDPDGALRPYLVQRRGFLDASTALGLDDSLLQRCLREGPLAADRGRPRSAGIACVPMHTGATNRGLIYCERQDGVPGFTNEDLRYLFSVALSAALALDGLRTYGLLTRRSDSLARQLQEQYNMVGQSAAMQEVFRLIRKVAPSDAGVLICGPSGTGKEMVAHAIHSNSSRSEGPLEIVNGAAVPPTLLESDLFGHVRGAFTGAVADKPGRFELADGGTLFLDEVGELPLECQAKLLRVLEEGRVRRVGDTRSRPADVRLIAATNRDPLQAQAEGVLRPDLFYRLDRLRIELPALSERRDDIELLARHFLQRFSQQVRHPVHDFAPEVLQVFRAYSWPGNVRELRNVVERMVILADSPVLGADLLTAELREAASEADCAGRSLADVERDHIAQVLAAAGGNKSRAADALGIDRSTLYAKLKRYGIEG